MKGDLVQVSAFLCEQEILDCKKETGKQQQEVGSKVNSEPRGAFLIIIIHSRGSIPRDRGRMGPGVSRDGTSYCTPMSCP